MDLNALFGQIDKFGKDYPGFIAVAALAASVVVPVGWDLIKGRIAKAQNRPTPKTGRWAGFLYGIGRWFKMVAKRLATDSEALAAKNVELTTRSNSLSRSLESTKTHLSSAKTRGAELEASNKSLAQDLQDATDEVERLGKALLRARGTDHKANQESFPPLRPAPVPQPVWLIKKSVLTGYLEFKNVGGGKATSVSVDTNLPMDVTLVDAHYDAVGKNFSSRFAIEPANMRESFDLVYTVSYVDEAGKHQTVAKRAAEQ